MKDLSMNIKNFSKICFLFCSLLMVRNLHAEPQLALGKKLSPEELQKLQGSDIKLDDQSFKIITEQTSTSTPSKRTQTTTSNPKTFVADDRGIVGVSQNIVIISEISPTKVRSVAKHIINTTKAVQYYDHLNVSSLQFRTFKQAIVARNELVKLLPNAQVTLPIKFSEDLIR